jgi:DNA-binding HxlR family transcriptional regulator
MAINAVGDRWSFLILRECFFGVRRFVDFQRNLGIARNILSARLSRLTRDGILERRRYNDRPVREEYRLTEKGRDLYKVIVAFVAWGERWVAGIQPLGLRHQRCGGEVGVYIFCEDCGEAVDARQVRFTTFQGEDDPEIRDKNGI